MITTNNKKFTCPECKNENTVSDDVQVGEVIECEFCGIEFEVTDKNSEGEFVLQVLEEEK